MMIQNEIPLNFLRIKNSCLNLLKITFLIVFYSKENIESFK